MRNISTVITQILALLPDPSTVTPDFTNNIIALRGELGALQRRSLYTAPEDITGWANLTDVLFRYLPTASPTSGNTWAWAISLVVLGAAGAAPAAK